MGRSFRKLSKYAFPAQQKLCSENLHLFLHVEAIATTKKNTGGNLRILKVRGPSGAGQGSTFVQKPLGGPPLEVHTTRTMSAVFL